MDDLCHISSAAWTWTLLIDQCRLVKGQNLTQMHCQPILDATFLGLQGLINLNQCSID